MVIFYHMKLDTCGALLLTTPIVHQYETEYVVLCLFYGNWLSQFCWWTSNEKSYFQLEIHEKARSEDRVCILHRKRLTQWTPDVGARDDDGTRSSMVANRNVLPAENWIFTKIPNIQLHLDLLTS